MRLIEEGFGKETRAGGSRRAGNAKYSTSTKPVISVITPVYNAAAFLEKSIQSVIGQRYDNVEYIIIDGSSTDGTLDILQAYNTQIDYWISERDQGIYDAMNKGIDAATGKWLYFLGADDILVNGLHKIVPYLKNSRHVYYGNVYMPRKNREYDGLFTWEKVIDKNICHQAIFYPRQLFQHHRYDTRFKVLADYELNLRCWHEFPFRYIPILVAIHNDDGTSIHTVDEEFQRVKLQLIEAHFGHKIRNRTSLLPLRRAVARGLACLRLKELAKKLR